MFTEQQERAILTKIKKKTYEDLANEYDVSRWQIYKVLKKHDALKLETKTLDDYKSVFNRMWACGRPMGKYRGKYPLGFMKRLANLINFDGREILHLFSGTIGQNQNHKTVDINPNNNPTWVADVRESLPIPDASFDVVIADPPYDRPEKSYSKELYDEEPVKPYSFIDEASRVLKVGGYLCILHHLVYITPDNFDRKAVIGVTTGPNMRIRTLNIFKKKR